VCVDYEAEREELEKLVMANTGVSVKDSGTLLFI